MSVLVLMSAAETISDFDEKQTQISKCTTVHSLQECVGANKETRMGQDSLTNPARHSNIIAGGGKEARGLYQRVYSGTLTKIRNRSEVVECHISLVKIQQLCGFAHTVGSVQLVKPLEPTVSM